MNAFRMERQEKTTGFTILSNLFRSAMKGRLSNTEGHTLLGNPEWPFALKIRNNEQSEKILHFCYINIYFL